MPETEEARPFVVVSGIPASGKTSLAKKLSPLLELPVIDKDDLLVHLFENNSCETAKERTELSRRSDDIFRERASASSGALLVSFWNQEGMPSDSGTPLDWVFGLSSTLAAIHCECSPQIALDRFERRTRHHGHQDALRAPEDLEKQFLTVSALGSISFPNQISVDTEREVDLGSLTNAVKAALARRITIP